MTETQLAPFPPTLRAAGGMIDIDSTVFVSAAIFLLLMLLLNKLLFQPYLAIVNERVRMSVGAQSGAEAVAAKAMTAVGEYEAKLAAARSEAAALREELRSTARREESEIVETARASATRDLTTRRERLATQLASAEREVSDRASTLSHAIVARVLS